VEILQSADDDQAKELIDLLKQKKIVYLHHLEGYYKPSFFKKLPKFNDLSLETDRFNILHWIMYFNKPKVL
jgi:hypothetical protein